MNVLMHLMIESFFKEFTPVRVTEDDVLERLSRLNISKSEGPDLLHPRVRVVYEIRHEIKYPLTKIFNRSLETRKVPEIWKCANIVPIYNKSSATAEDGRPYKQLKRLCLHRRCIEYLATGNFYVLAWRSANFGRAPL